MLLWADKIRERLSENYDGQKFESYKIVRDFLGPIMEWAENEESRIRRGFDETKN